MTREVLKIELAGGYSYGGQSRGLCPKGGPTQTDGEIAKSLGQLHLLRAKTSFRADCKGKGGGVKSFGQSSLFFFFMEDKVCSRSKILEGLFKRKRTNYLREVESSGLFEGLYGDALKGFELFLSGAVDDTVAALKENDSGGSQFGGFLDKPAKPFAFY